MAKPNPSRALVVVGILLCFIGAFVVYGVPPLVTAFIMARDDSAVVVNFLPTLIAGAATFLIGMIFLLVGVSRAAAGIDYLVSVARDPHSVVQRRAREDWFSHE